MNCIINFENLQNICKYETTQFSDNQVESICRIGVMNTHCDIDHCPIAERILDED